MGRRTFLLGHSRDGRPIQAVETGEFASRRKILVVGCVHGTECAGLAVARRLTRMTPPAGLDLWVIPNLNPDGSALHRRGNARGVDLNRNFPWRWEPLAAPYKSGPAPLSEPETRIAFRLIERIRPSVSIWFHQHEDLVDDSDPAWFSVPIEWAFAETADMRMAPLSREPGSAVNWENHCVPAATAFVVELPAGPVGLQGAYVLAHAVVAAANAAPDERPALAASCEQ